MPHPIRKFMTSPVRTIRSTSTLAEAHRWMNDLGVRHLPVFEGGQLVGLVSQRDLHLVETLKAVDPRTVTVDDAMSQDAFVVAPETPLAEVCQRMADRKLGSAIVVDDQEVIGIFTTVDACRAIGTVLSERKPARGPATKARTAKKPAATAPAAKKTTAKKPAKKAATKSPATKPAAKKVAKKPIAKKPMAKKPVAKKASAKTSARPRTAMKKAAAK